MNQNELVEGEWYQVYFDSLPNIDISTSNVRGVLGSKQVARYCGTKTFGGPTRTGISSARPPVTFPVFFVPATQTEVPALARNVDSVATRDDLRLALNYELAIFKKHQERSLEIMAGIEKIALKLKDAPEPELAANSNSKPVRKPTPERSL